MSASPHANGGLLRRDLELPDTGDYAVQVPAPGVSLGEATRVLGTYLRDVIRANRDSFRIMGPDEISRRPVASLNYLLTSHVWRQDHNGSTHRDPGFLDVVVNKKSEVTRIYLPPDANSLLWVADQCLRSTDCANVIVAGKQPGRNWMSMDEAVAHCTRGLGIWTWASSDAEGEPDVVMPAPEISRRWKPFP